MPWQFSVTCCVACDDWAYHTSTLRQVGWRKVNMDKRQFEVREEGSINKTVAATDTDTATATATDATAGSPYH